VNCPVRVAVVDSGSNLYDAIAGGLPLAGVDLQDSLGHGTAVAATILDQNPALKLYIVRIFAERLACHVELLARAIDWCAANRMDVANLSMGTQDHGHAAVLQAAVDEASRRGTLVVSAYGWYPGALAGAIAVDEDRTCPYGEVRSRLVRGRRILTAPGASAGGRMHGISFAVANATAAIVRLLSGGASKEHVLDLFV
jgi:hypothetical protein